MREGLWFHKCHLEVDEAAIVSRWVVATEMAS
jgi:hypothetical protein